MPPSELEEIANFMLNVVLCYLRTTLSVLRSKTMIFGGHVISASSNDLETPGKINKK